SLKLADLKDQIYTLLHIRKDMFNTYEYIFSKIKNTKAIFFFNMGRYAKYDKNPSHKNKAFQKLIKQIHSKNLVELHPSYASNSNYNLISKEKKWLEEIVGEKIISGRQHYLKLEMPATYQQLIANEIQNDFTIGYGSAYGFRAGTCRSFLFFDLKKDEATNLRLFPFAIMEGTLNDVMQLSVDESKEIISDLVNVVCKYEGIFISIWHNSTLSDKDGWKGWRDVFEFMLAEIEKRKLANFFN
ncbi:MAG TPA: polysaccharide deacetylase family protein, partial [Parafilimonas sp.]|nr:polysaccharide deacetylase family protein [Parafilimonas sp.]